MVGARALIALACAVGLTAPVASQEETRGNLIRNPGFEEGASSYVHDSNPHGWNYWKPRGKTHHLTLDPEVRHSGQHSARIGECDSSFVLLQKHPARPGQVFGMGCYLKTELAAGSVAIVAKWLHEGEWAGGGRRSRELSGRNDWTLLELSDILAPDGVDTIYVTINARELQGAAWCDDVSLERVEVRAAQALPVIEDAPGVVGVDFAAGESRGEIEVEPAVEAEQLKEQGTRKGAFLDGTDLTQLTVSWEQEPGWTVIQITSAGGSLSTIGGKGFHYYFHIRPSIWMLCRESERFGWCRTTWLAHLDKGGVRISGAGAYVAGLCARPLSEDEANALFAYRERMVRASVRYGEVCVEEVRALDEARQVERALEMLGLSAERKSPLPEARQLHAGTQRLLQQFARINREGQRACAFRNQSGDELFAEFEGQAEECESSLSTLRAELRSELRALGRQARQRHRWFRGFRFPYAELEPLPRGKLLPVEEFGKRFFLGLASANRADYYKVLRPLGLDFDNRSHFAASYTRHLAEESTYDFDGYLRWLDDIVADGGLPESLYPVYMGWCWLGLPKWLADRLGDDAWMQDADGFIGTTSGNVYHPEVQRVIFEHAKAFGKAIRGNPNIFFNMLFGEAYPNVVKPGANASSNISGYSRPAQEAFRRHLREKYETIDALNQAWGAAHESFEAIEPPRGIEGRSDLTPLIYEFERFRGETWNAFIQTIVRNLKESDPTHLTVTNGCWHGWDTVDHYSFDIPCSGVGGGGFGMIHDFQNGLRAKHSWARFQRNPRYIGCRELNVYGDEGRSFGVMEEDLARNIVERGFWHIFSFDYTWALLFAISQVGGENPGDNVLDGDLANSTIRWSIAAAPMMRDRWNRLRRAYLDSQVVAPRIAILSSDLQSMSKAPATGVSLRHLFRSHYNYGYTYAKCILDGREDLGRYRVLMAACPYLEEGMAEHLLAWVEAGGCLIMATPSGLYDKFGRYDGRLVRELFGIDRVERSERSYRPADGSAPQGAEVLERSDQGEPTVLRAGHGKGRAYLSFVPLDVGERPDLMVGWIREVIPRPAAACDQPLVERIVRESEDGTRYLCITNLTYQQTYRCVFDLDGCYGELVDLGVDDGMPVESRWDGTTTSFRRTLGPGEGTIILLGKVRAPDTVPMRERLQPLPAPTAASDLVREAREEAERVAVDPVAATRARLLCGLAGEYLARGIEDEAEDLLSKALGAARGAVGTIFPRRGEIHLECPRVAPPPAIDGKLDEWQPERWEQVLELRSRAGDVPGPPDFEVRFTTGWDANSLYVAVRTVDDMMSSKGTRMARPPDSVGVHLNLLDDEGFPKRTGVADGLPLPGYGPDDFKLRFDMAGNSRPDLVEPLNPLDIRDLPGIECAVTATQDGWDLEVAIPWEPMHLEPTEGYVIGFNLEASDEDDGNFERQLTYRESPWDTTTNWARMQLVGP